MAKILISLFFVLFMSGCADIPIKDGELVVGKDTTASVEDGAVAKVRSQF